MADDNVKALLSILHFSSSIKFPRYVARKRTRKRRQLEDSASEPESHSS
jgi:hypothetical protein